MLKTRKIVLLHGWRVPLQRYNSVKAELEKRGYRVYIPELPGHCARCELNEPWSLANYAEFVSQFCKNEGIEKCIVIGHSFGGRVGIKFAAQYPHRVEKLILSGTPGFSNIPARRLKLYKIVAKLGGILFNIFPLNLIKPAVRNVYCKLIGARDYSATTGYLRETFKNIVSEELVDVMSNLKVEVILVYGEADKIVPSWIAKKMLAVLPNAKLKILNQAGHNLPFSKPKLFLNNAGLLSTK